MFEAKRMLDQLLSSKQSSSAAGAATSLLRKAGATGLPGGSSITGVITGGGGNLLSGLLRGGGRSGKLASYAGVAALSTMAVRSLRNWRAKSKRTAASSKNAPKQQQTELDFDSLPSAEAEKHSRAILSALIAAAKADGQFDQHEREMIKERTEELGDRETVAWVQQEIKKPLDVDQIAAMADSPEMAAEIYLSSLIIIDEQNEREKAYLDALAEKLDLDPDLRLELEQQLNQ